MRFVGMISSNAVPSNNDLSGILGYLRCILRRGFASLGL